MLRPARTRQASRNQRSICVAATERLLELTAVSSTLVSPPRLTRASGCASIVPGPVSGQQPISRASAAGLASRTLPSSSSVSNRIVAASNLARPVRALARAQMSIVPRPVTAVASSRSSTPRVLARKVSLWWYCFQAPRGAPQRVSSGCSTSSQSSSSVAAPYCNVGLDCVRSWAAELAADHRAGRGQVADDDPRDVFEQAL